MTIGTLKTQGTELFVNDTVTSAGGILKFACPTGISGLGGAADQLDDTCLDALVDRTFKRGLGNPGQVSVPFNFIPSNASHQTLFDLQADGAVLNWLVCLSDGTAVPVAADSDGYITPPASRTSIAFQAYISDVTIDIATNDIVRGTLTLQRSGVVTPYFNGPTP